MRRFKREDEKILKSKEFGFLLQIWILCFAIHIYEECFQCVLAFAVAVLCCPALLVSCHTCLDVTHDGQNVPVLKHLLPYQCQYLTFVNMGGSKEIRTISQPHIIEISEWVNFRRLWQKDRNNLLSDFDL